MYKNEMAKNLIIGKKVLIGYLGMMALSSQSYYGFKWLPFMRIWHKYCYMKFVIHKIFLKGRSKYEKLCNWVDFGFWDFDCFGVCLRWLNKIFRDEQHSGKGRRLTARPLGVTSL